jgi:aminopeptidase-like protein
VNRNTAADVSPEAHEILALAAELMPICRSITGDGIRATLRVLSREIPLTIHEIPTGTPALDWTVPNEWNIRDAYIKNPDGMRLVDFQRCSLHVVNYSVPVHTKLSRADLDPYLHSLPERPAAIPYRTSYYTETWGFCLSQHQRDSLGEGPFEICIDSTLSPGALTFGECFVPGETEDEILISVHCCHPFMGNDNLSGIALAVQLAKRMRGRRQHLGVRFLFIPATIGSLVWLSRNDTGKIRHGLVLSCLGDRGQFTYKKTRAGVATIDEAVAHVLGHTSMKGTVEDFSPYGYDERQYNSPGFKLPVGCLMRTPNGRFPEYHSSDDNLEFLCAQSLAESFDVLCTIIEVLEGNERFVNLMPFGEPQLGRRGLYGATPEEFMPILWVLNFSDGDHSLLDIANRARLPFKLIKSAADRLTGAGLLRIASHGSA